MYAYFLISETKGLSLEQVDRMLEESAPRTSASWRAKTTWAAAVEGHHVVDDVSEKISIEDDSPNGSAV